MKEGRDIFNVVWYRRYLEQIFLLIMAKLPLALLTTILTFTFLIVGISKLTANVNEDLHKDLVCITGMDDNMLDCDVYFCITYLYFYRNSHLVPM